MRDRDLDPIAGQLGTKENKMKITKRQLKRIIREEKARLSENEFYRGEPSAELEEGYLNAEEALQALIAALVSMDPADAGDMARYAIEELHGFKR